MSDNAASNASPAAKTERQLNYWLLFGLWAVIAGALVVRVVMNAQTWPLIVDTDDAMRLVMVRDLLDGQGWFDTVQHRLNTPFGASIHWSRLVDVPIAGILFVLRQIVGDNADTVTAIVWPLLLLLMMMGLSAKLAVRLVGREAMLPGLVLPVLSAALMPEFSPGRLDHHNIQALLTLAIVLATISAWKSPRAGLVAGFFVATSLAIGTEILPIAAAAIVAFGLFWVIDPARATQLRYFGISFALSAFAHLAVALPPAQWLQPACDANSIVIVGAAFGTGVLFVLLPFMRTSTPNWPMRLGVGVGAGCVLLGALIFMFPQCLTGPYAELDPWLEANWIANITEAQPLWVSMLTRPGIAVAFALPIFTALVVTVWRIRRGPEENRAEWLVLLLFLTLATLVMMLQIRGGRLAAPLAIPAGAWLIVTMRKRYLASSHIKDAGALIGAWLLFAGFAFAIPITWLHARIVRPQLELVGNATAPVITKATCLLPASYAALAKREPQSLMTPIDLGSHVLAFTPHSVVGAPYHRNKDGMLDTVRFFNRPVDEARNILKARGITTIVTCAGLVEMRGYPNAADDSFVRLVARDELPAWIVDVSPPDAIFKTYEVVSD